MWSRSQTSRLGLGWEGLSAHQRCCSLQRWRFTNRDETSAWLEARDTSSGQESHSRTRSTEESSNDDDVDDDNVVEMEKNGKHRAVSMEDAGSTFCSLSTASTLLAGQPRAPPSRLKYPFLHAHSFDVPSGSRGRVKSCNMSVDVYLTELVTSNRLPQAARQLEKLSTTAEWQTLDVEAKQEVLRAADARGNTMLHEAARHGWCRKFVQDIALTDLTAIVNLQNHYGETALHVASKYCNVDDVEILVDAGATLTTDDDGWSALHSAAAATSPRWQIARRLVETARRSGDLTVLSALTRDRQSSVLHLAAANINADKDFFCELIDFDPTVRNVDAETPFHVAAKCSNADVILSMLEIFPVGSCVYATDMKIDKELQQQQQQPLMMMDASDAADDELGSQRPTLLNTCAANGNARAVSILIQRGADLRQGALHEIVQESVRNRSRLGQLIDVYRAIADNAVEWWSAETGHKCPKHESLEYALSRRKAMIWLINKPHPTDGKNVIQRAIALGAVDMLVEIINTPGVFRFDLPRPTSSHVARGRKFASHNIEYARYDVTNFEDATLSSFVVDKKMEVCQPPDCSYLDLLMKNKHVWRENAILNRQPFRELTKSLLWFASRFYFLLGAVQMTFMICFSVVCMPTTCSLVSQFNITSHHSVCPGHNSTDADSETAGTASSAAEQRRYPSALWLLWPVILLLYTLTMYCSSVLIELQSILGLLIARLRRCSPSRSSVYKPISDEEALTRLLLTTCDRLPMFAFSISVFIWFYQHNNSTHYPLYLEVTAMVFLFGWLTNFMFFSGISKHVYIFSVVLKEIIIKEIVNSFMLIFVFTIVAFSFALHALGLTTLPPDDALTGLNVTVYEVFTAALTMGEFFDSAGDLAYSTAGGRLWFYKVLFGVYVCFSAIVLLNVLIAMMNHRYDNAVRRAETVWRYNTVAFGLRFHRFPLCRCIIRSARQLTTRCCQKAFEDDQLPGRYLLNVKLCKHDRVRPN